MLVRDITQNLHSKSEIRVTYDDEEYSSSIESLPTYLLDKPLEDADYRYNPKLRRWEFEL